MGQLSVPEDLFHRLAVRAAALDISVDDLVRPALDQLAGSSETGVEIGPPPLSGDAWLAELEAWTQDALNRSARYPSGFKLDDSREMVYQEREDAQL